MVIIKNVLTVYQTTPKTHEKYREFLDDNETNPTEFSFEDYVNFSLTESDYSNEALFKEFGIEVKNSEMISKI